MIDEKQIDFALLAEQQRYALEACGILLQRQAQHGLIAHLEGKRAQALSVIQCNFGPLKTIDYQLISEREIKTLLVRSKNDWAEDLSALTLLEAAVLLCASDIHIDAQTAQYRVRLRIDGSLQKLCEIDPNVGVRLVESIKVLADIDIARRAQPSDGRINLELCGDKVNFRVGAMPCIGGDSLVLRVLDNRQITPKLVHLFDHDQQRQFDPLLKLVDGLLLIVGPTGAGKSTTLHAVLDALDDGRRSIIAIEDPVERPLHGIRQCEVKQAEQAQWLRAALRQDPDIIMVGEIRDAQTALLAVKAARSGHLVLSTLHCGHYSELDARLQEWGISIQQLSGTLKWVLVQRLFRRFCPQCHGAACIACRQSGYSGRFAVAEFNDAEQRHGATLRDLALEAVAAGRCDRAEINRVLGDV